MQSSRLIDIRWAPCLFFLLCSIFSAPLQAQQQENGLEVELEADSTYAAEEMEAKLEAVRALVSNLQLYLNFLGDEGTGLRDKDVIINQSYSKIFMGDQVQVEDDLDTNRAVVTYKPVQAYLKDIDFFFNEARFDFRIISIEPSYRENGEPFFLIKAVRTLEARDLLDSTYQNEQERYIEINEVEDDLKIASIYTTQLNRVGERRNWWNNLNPEWRKQLAGEAKLNDAITFADISFFNKDLLLTATDTFLLQQPDTLEAKTGNPVRSTMESSLPTTAAELSNLPQDSMPTNWQQLAVKTEQVDMQLEKLLQIRNLTLETAPEDLAPISRLTALQTLDLSNLGISDISALRQLSRLRELDISGNPITDFSALRFLSGLEVLIADSTQISSLSEIRRLTKLKVLSLENCPITVSQELEVFEALQRLNLNYTAIDSLPDFSQIKGISDLSVAGTKINSLKGVDALAQLQFLQASATNVTSLEPLSQSIKLEQLTLNQTPVNSLKPLTNLKGLKRVYCDETKIGASEANALMEEIPGLLVVYASDYLRGWWNAMSPDWQKVFANIYRFSDKPDKEMLQRMTSLQHLQLAAFPEISTLAPVSQLHKLEELDISGTAITSLGPLEAISSLQLFTAENCKLDSPGTQWALKELRNHPGLEEVNLDKTGVVDLSPLYALEQLKSVQVDSNGITDSIAGLFRAAQPEVLLIYRTPELRRWWDGLNEDWQGVFRTNLRSSETVSISKFTLEHLARTKSLFVPPASVSGLDQLRMLQDLERLEFAGNQVYSLSPLRELPKLTVVDCSNNPIVEISPLSALPNLSSLNISNTPVKSLDELESNAKMKELRCSGTPIKTLNVLVNMPELELLDCSNTKVRNLKALNELAGLKKLIAFNTAVSKYKIEAFQAANPDCEVVFY